MMTLVGIGLAFKLFWVFIEFSLAVPIIVLEEVSPADALDRSELLVHGYASAIFFILLFAILGSRGLEYILLSTNVLDVHFYWINATSNTIFQSMAMGLLVSLYFSARARNDESFTLNELRGELDRITNDINKAEGI